jgi:hypothetical protein
MITKILYKCNLCGEERVELMKIGEPPATTFKHEECTGTFIRQFGDVSIDKQLDTVSFATQQMLYSKNPSGKTKSIV